MNTITASVVLILNAAFMLILSAAQQRFRGLPGTAQHRPHCPHHHTAQPGPARSGAGQASSTAVHLACPFSSSWCGNFRTDAN